MKDRRLLVIFLFVFVDLLGYSLFLPIFPYFADALGARPTLIGVLVATNAVAQLIASPIIGRLSDRYGRRTLLIVSLLGTLAAFVLGGLSTALPLLFVSRVLDGLLGGDVALARAYIVDITDEKSRARGFGLIGAAFGLGFIVGPALGGTLSSWPAMGRALESLGLTRFAAPAFAAAGLALLNLLMVLAWLPETLTAEQRAARAADPKAAFTARALWEALHRRCVGPLLTTRLFSSLAFGLFQANFALYTKFRLGLDDRATSYILTYVGVLVVLVQGVAIGRLARSYGERRLIFGGLALLTLGLLAWALVPSVGWLLIVLAPLSLAAGVLNTVLGSYLSKTVFPQEVGGTLGLSSSLESLARVVAPLLGGTLIEGLGPVSLGLAGAAIGALLMLVAWRSLVALPEFPLPGCPMPEGASAADPPR